MVLIFHIPYTLIYTHIPSYTLIYPHIPSYTLKYHLIPSYTLIYTHIPSYTLIYTHIPSYTLIYHPSFKATLTGLRKTRLRKVQICPRLAETKRENIFSDHMNSRICLGSPRYWLHKFYQNIAITDSLSIFWHPLLAAGTNSI